MINLQNVQVKNGSTWQKICPFPVGFVYSSYTNTSPGSTFGGTWTPITGRFPYYNNGIGTGGSSMNHTHTLTSGYAYIGSDHGKVVFRYKKVPSFSTQWGVGSYAADSGTYQVSASDGTTLGGTTDGSGELLPPYQTLYAWRRTA